MRSNKSALDCLYSKFYSTLVKNDDFQSLLLMRLIMDDRKPRDGSVFLHGEKRIKRKRREKKKSISVENSISGRGKGRGRGRNEAEKRTEEWMDGKKDGRTDGRKKGWTDQPTDTAICFKA